MSATTTTTNNNMMSSSSSAGASDATNPTNTVGEETTAAAAAATNEIRPCRENAFCCGESCRCGDHCTCTETLCRCEASSVLNSLSPIHNNNNRKKKKIQTTKKSGSSLQAKATVAAATDPTTSPSNMTDPLLQQEPPPPPPPPQEQQVQNNQDDDSNNVRDSTTSQLPHHHQQAEFWIDGMTCTMCSQAIERAVSALPAVHGIAISLATDSAVVEYNDSFPNNSVVLNEIQEAIEAVGYVVQRVVPIQQEKKEAAATSTDNTDTSGRNDGGNNSNNNNDMEDVEERWQRLQQRQADKVAARKRAFLWSLVGALPILVLTMILPHQYNPLVTRHMKIGHYQLQLQAVVLWILATPVQFLAGWDFYKMAYFGIIQAGRAGMDVLIALGTSASYGYALYGVFSGDDELAHFFETSAVLICFVLAGKWMQALAVRRTSQALSQLMQLQAKTAVKVTPFKDRAHFHPRKDPYQEVTLPVQQIKAGDIVKVIRGASIPADGTILFGEISVDESMVTGESLPLLKTPGSVVLGGTVCVESSIEDRSSRIVSHDDEEESRRDVGAAFVEVTGVGSATALAQIVNLVHEAQTRAVPVQSFADAVSAVFVPAVCSISLLTFLVWYALCSSHAIPKSWYQGEDPMTFSLMFAIACLVISCPCALGLATPTAVMVGTGVAAKIGVLMKGGEALEIANKVDSVVFDKTGTLTLGKPAVSDILRLEDNAKEQEDELLWLVGSLERSSEHPLAKAVVTFAEERLGDKLAAKPFGQPTQFRAMTGRGATGKVGDVMVSVGNRAFADALGHEVSFVAEECMVSLEEDGKTAILVIINGAISAVLGVVDQIKPDAAAAIAYLRNRLGVDVWMITGDNRRTANAVRNKLGMPSNRVLAEALPAAKLEQVRKLQEEGSVIAFVGDGVNDSPALAQADIGISLGTGAEIANETSDVVLVKGHVADVCTALDLSRVIFHRIQWNFLWSLVYNCLGIPIAAGALYPLIHVRLPPTVAALAMALSSISVVLSSLMLRLYRPPDVAEDVERPQTRSRGRRASATYEQGNQTDGDDLRSNLLENDHLDQSEVTDATELIDNRTLSRMEEGRDSERTQDD